MAEHCIAEVHKRLNSWLKGKVPWPGKGGGQVSDPPGALEEFAGGNCAIVVKGHASLGDVAESLCLLALVPLRMLWLAIKR